MHENSNPCLKKKKMFFVLQSCSHCSQNHEQRALSASNKSFYCEIDSQGISKIIMPIAK